VHLLVELPGVCGPYRLQAPGQGMLGTERGLPLYEHLTYHEPGPR
jgi:hypothetical protein